MVANKVWDGYAMLNQFSRTQLLLGAEAMELLSNKKVAVFGIEVDSRGKTLKKSVYFLLILRV